MNRFSTFSRLNFAAAIITSSFFAAGTARGQVDVSFTTPDQTIQVASGQQPERFTALGNIRTFFDVVLAIDSSGSTAADSGRVAPNGGRRVIDWIASAADTFVNNIDDRVRVGVVEFDFRSEVSVDIDALGNNGQRQRITDAIGSIVPSGRTNLGRGITTAASTLRNADSIAQQQHIVLLTDGRPNAFNPRTTRNQTQNDVRNIVNQLFPSDDIDSLSTIALPGSSLGFVEELADIGGGVFADATDITSIEDQFDDLFGELSLPASFEVELPDGTVFHDIPISNNGDFSVTGGLDFGENIFTARATSTSGQVFESQLRVNVVSAVPEPSSATLALLLGTLALARRRRS